MWFAPILAALVWVPPAAACSCAGSGAPTAASCAEAPRVFAGTVAAYDWPLAYEAAYRPVHVRLAVDAVWAGPVPPTVGAYTGFGGGDCGLTPLPGTSYVVCDEGVGGEEPALHACSPPAFGAAADAIVAALGPSEAPSWRASARWPNRWDVQTALTVVIHQAPLALPLGGVVLGALAGALVRRRRPREAAPRRRGIGVALALFVAGIVALRLALPSIVADALERFAIVTLGGLCVATIAGVVTGYARQRDAARDGGPRRGFAGSVVVTALVLVAVYAPLHLPLQRDDAVACSLDRARAWLRAPLPAAEPPRACTDLGLTPMRVLERWGGACLEFPDGDGGIYAVCGDGEVAGYGWELPG